MLKNRFTNHYHNCIINAYIYAKGSQEKKVTIETILLALINEKGCVGGELLRKTCKNIEIVRQILIKKTTATNIKNSPDNISINAKGIQPAFTNEVAELVKKSILFAYSRQHYYIGTEHLAAALIANKNFIKTFANFFNFENLKTQIDSILKSTSKFSEIAHSFEYMEDSEVSIDENINPGILPPGLSPININNFLINLTDPETQKDVDPVIGREKEINQIIQILCRRAKNNPLLLGDPGVGKTAIIEGLAKKILSNNVPDVLINKKIFSLDLSAVLSGTIYRGEFENRLKMIIDEIKQDQDAILFIDEVHNIVGAGSSAGSMDAANILKPVLARGKVKCIGATTYEEYKQHIEKDAALERRFQPIQIQEPSEKKSIEILKGVKNNYERFHNISISDEVIEKAVALSIRYIQDRFLPDKAIDLIDETAAKVSIKTNNNSLLKQIKLLQERITTVQNKKQGSLLSEEYQKAIECQESEQLLFSKLIEMKKLYKEKLKKNKGKITITDILDVLAHKTNIPVGEIKEKESNNLLNLENELQKYIIGQNESIRAISNHIRKARAGISDPNRPIGSFLFLGPSGVGKTETAKILAEQLYKDKGSFIRIDMSEFSESFNMSKLIGSPAGYVGYREGTLLTDKVKKHPYSVILFDEIEKAHKNVFNILLQILDEGFITDAIGKKINFTNTIIILTSNIGADYFNEKNIIGFDENNKVNNPSLSAINDELKQIMPSELLNRIDKIIHFNTLGFQDLQKIVKIHIDKLNNRLQEKNIHIIPDMKVIDFIAKESKKENKGARMITKNIEEYIETPLSEKILQNQDLKDIHIKIDKNKVILI